MIFSSQVLLPALVAFATAIMASLATYVSVRRAKSGRINTTEADVLWKEAGKIRRELADRVRELQAEIERNGAEIAELRTENATLKHEVLTLRQENAALNVQVDELKRENKELRQATADVEGRQRELQNGGTPE